MPTLPNFTDFSQTPGGIPGVGPAPQLPGASVSLSAQQIANAPTPQQLMEAETNYLGAEGNVLSDQGLAKADTVQATGYANEAAAYGTVSGVAETNAALAQRAGDLEVYQQGLAAQQAQGQASAANASNGFGAGGSNVAIMASNKRQAALTAAMGNIQTAETVGGYNEQEAAAKAEQAQATGAAGAATAASEAATTSGNFAQVVGNVQAVNLASMTQYAAEANDQENQGYAENFVGGYGTSIIGPTGLNTAGQQTADQLGQFGQIAQYAQQVVNAGGANAAPGALPTPVPTQLPPGMPV